MTFDCFPKTFRRVWFKFEQQLKQEKENLRNTTHKKKGRCYCLTLISE